MTETNGNITTPEIDPILTNDMSDVKPDAPIVPQNDYVLEVVKVEQRHNEKKNSNYLNIQLKSIEPITSVIGEPLPAGMSFFGRIALTPTEKLTQAAIQRAMKRFMLCFGVPNGAIAPLDQWTGKRGSVNIGFSKKTDEYPEDRNEVKQFNAPRG